MNNAVSLSKTGYLDRRIGIERTSSEQSPGMRSRRLANRRIIIAMSFCCYVSGACVLMTFAHLGSVPTWVPAAHFGTASLFLGIFALLWESGYTAGLSDESLTVIELWINILIQLSFAWLVPQIALSLFAAMFVSFSVATQSLTMRQTLTIFALTCCGIAVVIFTARTPVGMPMSTPGEQITSFACYASLLFQTAMVGCYGSSIRAKLHRHRIELKEANKKISEVADIDGLTGIANRRVIMDHLDQQAMQFQTAQTPCAIALFDIDWFKKINDTFGHPIGDDVLQTFAATITANLRDADMFGRYGGEEFLLILPETGAGEAERIVDRLRIIIATSDWSAIASEMRVTVSAGVAAMTDGDAPDEILSRVDAALYCSKQTGRNCVTLAA